jgi:hypothetical protein
MNIMNTYHESWIHLFDKFNIYIDELYSVEELLASNIDWSN